LIEEPGPLRELLTTLINVAFRTGASLPSWRKAVITMIPKKKEDGKWTDKVRDMRPISVLQEFGKMASKILATRIGDRILATPLYSIARNAPSLRMAVFNNVSTRR
jgi:hypothetical protein